MTTARTEKLDLRLSEAAKAKLRAAARAERRSISEFVLESALARADETLPDRRYFGLGEARWAEFMKALDAPPRSHPRMQRLLRRPSVFESK